MERSTDSTCALTQKSQAIVAFRSVPARYHLETQHFTSNAPAQDLIDHLTQALKTRGVYLGLFDEKKCKFKADVVIREERINFRVFLYTEQEHHIVEFQRRSGDGFAFNELYFSVFEEMQKANLVSSFDHVAEFPISEPQEPIMHSDEGLDYLLGMVNSEFVDIKLNGVVMVARLATVKENAKYLVCDKVMDAVVSALESGDRDVIRCCASIIGNLGKTQEGRKLGLTRQVHEKLEESRRLMQQRCYFDAVERCGFALENIGNKNELVSSEAF